MYVKLILPHLICCLCFFTILICPFIQTWSLLLPVNRAKITSDISAATAGGQLLLLISLQILKALCGISPFWSGQTFSSFAFSYRIAPGLFCTRIFSFSILSYGKTHIFHSIPFYTFRPDHTSKFHISLLTCLYDIVPGSQSHQTYLAQNWNSNILLNTNSTSKIHIYPVAHARNFEKVLLVPYPTVYLSLLAFIKCIVHIILSHTTHQNPYFIFQIAAFSIHQKERIFIERILIIILILIIPETFHWLHCTSDKILKCWSQSSLNF
jgi:hypothetical protein